MSRLERLAKAKEITDLSPAGYVEREGIVCPVCRAHSACVQTDETWVEAGRLTQLVQCSECESTWYDVYTLIGYENITYGDPYVDAPRENSDEASSG